MTSALGTIHILRKHFIAQNLILLPNFSQKLGFFVKTKEFLFQHYILTKCSSCSLKYLVHKEEEIAQKIRENVGVGKKKCLRNI